MSIRHGAHLRSVNSVTAPSHEAEAAGGVLCAWRPSAEQWPMKHGRIIKVSERRGYTTNIVAEEDAAKAEAFENTGGARRSTRADRAGRPGTSRAVRRPSFVAGFKPSVCRPGEYKKTQNY